MFFEHGVVVVSIPPRPPAPRPPPRFSCFVSTICCVVFCCLAASGQTCFVCVFAVVASYVYGTVLLPPSPPMCEFVLWLNGSQTTDYMFAVVQALYMAVSPVCSLTDAGVFPSAEPNQTKPK